MSNNFIRTKIFLRELFEGLYGLEELSFHKDLIIYFEIIYISGLLVPVLGHKNLRLESTLQFITKLQAQKKAILYSECTEMLG